MEFWDQSRNFTNFAPEFHQICLESPYYELENKK